MPGLHSIGVPELLILLVIILTIFGAGKLPYIARGLGQAIGDFHRASQGLDVTETRETKKERTEHWLCPGAGAAGHAVHYPAKPSD